jgi:protease-4
VSLETDLLLDRRRLKRRLFAWRVFAILAVLVAVLAWLGRASILLPPPMHVARLRVDGLITENRRLVEAVNRLADDDHVAALIVSVDSPGGSVAGGEALHDAIARVAARKPVVAVMRGLAASAGYMVSVPAARIFASEATLTGSIGVLLQTAGFSGLLEKVGVDADTIVSGPLKDQPGLTHPLSPEGRQVLDGLVMDLYDQFVGMVATGRHMSPDRVRQLGDGRAYTGRQALALGLIDQIGDESAARDWLAKERQVGRFLPVRDVRTDTLQDRLTRGVTGMFGTVVSGVLRGAIESASTSPAVHLDGAWAVWQP